MMIKRNRMKMLLFAMLVVLSLGLTTNAYAAVTIKFGTLAPKDSPWYDALKKMGEEWKKASNGTVRLQIYPGGTIGNELDMVRKMRQGRLHGAMLTSIGIREIDPAILAMQLPMLVRNNTELDAAFKAVDSVLRKRIKDEGFVTLFYGDSGWVRFFTTKEVKTLKELTSYKYFTGASDQASKEAWSRAGFKTVQLNAADMLTSLQTGLIDGFVTPPLAALAMQWFGLAQYMVDFKLAPLVGATVVSDKIWEKIPVDLRPKLLEIAEKFALQEQGRIRALDASSIETMKKHGLTVVTWPPEQVAEMEKLINSAYGFMRGNVVPADVFDIVKQAAEKVRK